MILNKLLQGAWDAHVHFTPDSLSRAQDAVGILHDAAAAGMDGIVLKAHTAPTAITAHTINAAFPEGPRFYGSITLNPPVGGLNPAAVRAALDAGATVVWMPTYSSAFHVSVIGRTEAYPHDPARPDGLTILDRSGAILPEVLEILDRIAECDAVLATGHLGPEEVFQILPAARERGVERMVVTHASQITPGLTFDQQRRVIDLGAWVEHALLAATPCCPGHISLEELARHLIEIGPERLMLTSDFGQTDNGPVIPGFAAYLEQLIGLGISEAALRRMIADNPAAIHTGRRWQPDWQGTAQAKREVARN